MNDPHETFTSRGKKGDGVIPAHDRALKGKISFMAIYTEGGSRSDVIALGDLPLF